MTGLDPAIPDRRVHPVSPCLLPDCRVFARLYPAMTRETILPRPAPLSEAAGQRPGDRALDFPEHLGQRRFQRRRDRRGIG
jgi:hypothetical protein